MQFCLAQWPAPVRAAGARFAADVTAAVRASSTAHRDAVQSATTAAAERFGAAWRYAGMRKKRSSRPKSLAIATLGHAALAAFLGLLICGLLLASRTNGASVFDSIRDPAIALTLLLSVPSLLAAGSGISAFIFLSIERAHAGDATRQPRQNW